jgi:hypothetical protein
VLAEATAEAGAEAGAEAAAEAEAEEEEEEEEEEGGMPPPHQPWIATYEPGDPSKAPGDAGALGFLKVAYSAPNVSKKDGPVSLFQVVLNGVSVYSGPATPESMEDGVDPTSAIYYYAMNGVRPQQCYRFQVAYFAQGASRWSDLSSRLWVNDCSTFRAKLCRERGCDKGGSALRPTTT